MNTTSSLPEGVGIGFKAAHFDALMDDLQRVDFIEVHAENYLGDGGLPHAQLYALRQRLALSLHGVGLSIGGAQPLDRNHLRRLAGLCARYQPHAFSEHLAWSTHDGVWFGDLLPLSYSNGTLQRTIAHVDEVQMALGRRVLIENPSTYVKLAGSPLEEPQFLAELARRSGCGLLLDLNNVVVSCHNRGAKPLDYLRAFDLERVEEVHLAGHSEHALANGDNLRVDDHGGPVGADTWQLLEWLQQHVGAVPTLLEWDRNIPSWPRLAAEADAIRAAQAGRRLDQVA